eukprot:1008031-Prorocentrum_minimum.AAC.1
MVSLWAALLTLRLLSGHAMLLAVFVMNLGDGLAEPVGIRWGKHKYKVKALTVALNVLTVALNVLT